MKRKINSTIKNLSRKLKDFIKRNFKKLKNIEKSSDSEDISHDNYTLWFKA